MLSPDDFRRMFGIHQPFRLVLVRLQFMIRRLAFELEAVILHGQLLALERLDHKIENLIVVPRHGRKR